MAKDNRTKITFEYKGKNYTLVYSVDALKKMEKHYGIKFAKLDEQIISAPEELFVGAFIANHDDVPRKTRIEIYKALSNLSDDSASALTEVLGEMLAEAVEGVKPQGNVAWKVSRNA